MFFHFLERSNYVFCFKNYEFLFHVVCRVAFSIYVSLMHKKKTTRMIQIIKKEKTEELKKVLVLEENLKRLG